MDERLLERRRRWHATGERAAGLAYLEALERAGAEPDELGDLLVELELPRWRLVVVGGPQAGVTLPLFAEGVAWIGSAPDADLQLEGLVPRHACLQIQQRGEARTCELTPQAGAGVLHEGEPAPGPVELRDGDLLGLGPHELQIHTLSQPRGPTYDALRTAWFTVLTGEGRGQRVRVDGQGQLILANLIPSLRAFLGVYCVRWSRRQRLWRLSYDVDPMLVGRVPGLVAGDLAQGQILTAGDPPVSVRVDVLPEEVCRADAHTHLERSLASLPGDAEVGRVAVAKGEARGQEFTLRRGRNTIGSAPGSDVRVPEAPALAFVLELDLDREVDRAWIARVRELSPDLGGLRWYQLLSGDDLKEGDVASSSGAGLRELHAKTLSLKLRVWKPLHQPRDGWLVVTAGPDSGRRFPLRIGQQRVGRAGSCEVALSDPTVEPEAARVTLHRGSSSDLSAPHLGPPLTWEVDGAVVPLEDGERKRLGNTRLLVRRWHPTREVLAWLVAIDGPLRGDAHPIGPFGLTVGGDAEWTPDLPGLEPVQLRVTVNETTTGYGFTVKGSAAATGPIEGDPQRSSLRNGDVLRPHPELALRFETTPAGEGELLRLRTLPPIGAALATAGETEPATPLPPENPRVVRDVDLGGWTDDVVAAPDGHAVIVCKDEVWLLDPDGQEVWRRAGGRAPGGRGPKASAAAFSEAGQLLVAYSDGALAVWDPADGRTLDQWEPGEGADSHGWIGLHASPVEPFALLIGDAAGGSFEGTRDARLCGWDLEAGRLLWTHVLRMKRGALRPAFPAEGGVYVLPVPHCLDGGFELVDASVVRGRTRDGVYDTIAPTPYAPIAALAPMSPTHLLAIANGRLARWQRAAPHTLEPLAAKDSPAIDALIDPLALLGEDFAVCASKAGALEVWDLWREKRVARIPLPGDGVEHLAVDPRGRITVGTGGSRLRQLVYTCPPPAEGRDPKAPRGELPPAAEAIGRWPPGGVIVDRAMVSQPEPPWAAPLAWGRRQLRTLTGPDFARDDPAAPVDPSRVALCLFCRTALGPDEPCDLCGGEHLADLRHERARIHHRVWGDRRCERGVRLGLRPPNPYEGKKGLISAVHDPTAPAAEGVLVHCAKTGTWSVTLRDGRSQGFGVTLDDGRDVWVPRGRVRFHYYGALKKAKSWKTLSRVGLEAWLEAFEGEEVARLIPGTRSWRVELGVGSRVEVSFAPDSPPGGVAGVAWLRVLDD